MLFRQLRAKKAKFGFEASVHTDNFIGLAEGIKAAKALDPELKFEVTSNYGTCTAKVYTDSDAAGALLASSYCK